MEPLYAYFSDRLVSLMKLRGFTASRSPNGICMKSLAEFTDASEQICRRYIRGEALPSYEKIIKIASHLKVSPGWLLFGDQKDEPKRRVFEEDILAYILKTTHALFPENSNDFSEFVIGLLKDIRDIDVPNENLYKIVDLAVGSVATFQQKQKQQQLKKIINN
jgi:transcriptional regulator with XRE-family HTH domain